MTKNLMLVLEQKNKYVSIEKTFPFLKSNYICVKITHESITDYNRAGLGNRALLQEETTTNGIREVIELLDIGKLRVGWNPVTVNEWVKKEGDVLPYSKKWKR
jgi:hypothetical protein